ncbi:hypothetical protein M5689_015875 [Euphorbia peplus]|nr:hypothetical protein M5689_015875 [Euphorbia peplus]
MAAKNMSMGMILILCLALAHTSNAVDNWGWGGFGSADCSCTCRFGCWPVKQFNSDNNGGRSCSCTCQCLEDAFFPPLNQPPPPPSSPPPRHHNPSPKLPLPPPSQTPSPKQPTPTPSPPKTLPLPPQDAFPKLPTIADLIADLASCVDSYEGILPCYFIVYGAPQYISNECCQVFQRNKECLAFTQFGLPFWVRQMCRV